jgi:hypothetical protein
VTLLDVVGEVDVGLDDAAMLLEPEPHIPVNPDVASIPEVVDVPDVADMPDDVDAVPGVAALLGVVVPAIPPPSYVVGDPNVPDGEVPTVAHAAPLLALGTVIVPVRPLGTMLLGDALGGKPFGPTDSPGTIPNEEVMPGEGVAAVIPAWAKTGLLNSKDQIAATIHNDLMEDSPITAPRLRSERPQARQLGSAFFHHRAQRKACLSIRAEIDVPLIPALPAPMAPAPPVPALPTPLLIEHVAVLVVGGKTGIVGAGKLGPTVPATGNAPGSGTAGAEPTPRVVISVESRGMPVRVTPPGTVGAVDVGVDDEATLLEPEPHIPDIPEVSSDDVDAPDGTDISDDADVPGAAVGSVAGTVVPDVTMLPIVTAVAGAAVPGAVPPPS